MTTSPTADILDLDELRITIVVDNATDALSSIPPGVSQLPDPYFRPLHCARPYPPSTTAHMVQQRPTATNQVSTKI